MSQVRWLALLSIASSLGAQTVPVAQQFEKLHFRSIGPAIMSGRIADFAVYEKNTADLVRRHGAWRCVEDDQQRRATDSRLRARRLDVDR